MSERCSVCDLGLSGFADDEVVECLDWPGRFHHTECVSGCIECKGALLSERRGW